MTVRCVIGSLHSFTQFGLKVRVGDRETKYASGHVMRHYVMLVEVRAG